MPFKLFANNQRRAKNSTLRERDERLRRPAAFGAVMRDVSDHANDCTLADQPAGERQFLAELIALPKIEHHAEAVDELDVEGILAFAEGILPRASDLWVQALLGYKQRLQQLFFPEGIAYDGIRFDRTVATAPRFNYLAPSESAGERW